MILAGPAHGQLSFFEIQKNIYLDNLVVDGHLTRPVGGTPLSDRLDEDPGQLLALAGVPRDRHPQAFGVLDELDVQGDHLGHLVGPGGRGGRGVLDVDIFCKSKLF